MHEYTIRINEYLTKLGEGKETIPPPLLEEFSALAKEAIVKHFGPKPPRQFSLRPSNIGRPSCQLMAEKLGWPSEPFPPEFIMKMFFGDLVEAGAVVIMKAAGLNVTEQHTEVSGELASELRNGQLDIVLDDRIWDIKGVSRYAFDRKLRDGTVETWIGQTDPFGYLAQLYAYAELRGLKAGGWVCVCRETGEWAFVGIPDDEYDHWAETAHRIIASNTEKVGRLAGPEHFQREFEDVEEIFYRKPTGNRVLQYVCEQCKFKWKCWPGLQMLPQVVSDAKNPKTMYYTKLDQPKEPNDDN